MKKIKKLYKVSKKSTLRKKNAKNLISRKSKKTNPKTTSKIIGLKPINNKLDKILESQKRLLRGEHEIEKEEEQLEEEEKKDELGEETENVELKKIESELSLSEKNEDDELSKLQKLEEDIRKEVSDHPLKKITLKDIMKGFVGAFIGLAVHYTFTYGVEISQDLDITRASFLLALSFFVGILFIYTTGFRKVKDAKVLMFMPVRLLVLYISAVIVSILVLFLFYPTFGHNFVESYKMVAAVLLAAVVGACTADLIGKD